MAELLRESARKGFDPEDVKGNVESLADAGLFASGMTGIGGFLEDLLTPSEIAPDPLAAGAIGPAIGALYKLSEKGFLTEQDYRDVARAHNLDKDQIGIMRRAGEEFDTIEEGLRVKEVQKVPKIPDLPPVPEDKPELVDLFDDLDDVELHATPLDDEPSDKVMEYVNKISAEKMAEERGFKPDAGRFSKMMDFIKRQPKMKRLLQLGGAGLGASMIYNSMQNSAKREELEKQKQLEAAAAAAKAKADAEARAKAKPKRRFEKLPSKQEKMLLDIINSYDKEIERLR